MYAENPQSVLVYPLLLQAYNTAKWTGWHRVLRDTGPAMYTTASRSRTSTSSRSPARRPGARATTSCGWWLPSSSLVAVGIVVVVVARRGRSEEEA